MARRRIEVNVAAAEELARAGLSNEQIRHALGISSSTFYARQRENAEIAEALTRARARTEADVADKLMAMMDDPDTPPKVRFLAMTWWLERRGQGWTAAAVERAALEKDREQNLPPVIDVRVRPFNRDSPEMKEIRAELRAEWEQELREKQEAKSNEQ